MQNNPVAKYSLKQNFVLILLSQSTCKLTIAANYTRGGIYAVAIIAEDYPTTTITIGGKTYTPNDAISKTPYQVVLLRNYA